MVPNEEHQKRKNSAAQCHIEMPFVIKGALMKRARHSRNLERRGREEDKEAKNKERSFQMHPDAEHAHLAPKYKSPEATIRREMTLALILLRRFIPTAAAPPPAANLITALAVIGKQG